MPQQKLEETLTLLQQIWALFLIAVYFSGFMAEYHFPRKPGGTTGNGSHPLERTESFIFWIDVCRVSNRFSANAGRSA